MHLHDGVVSGSSQATHCGERDRDDENKEQLHFIEIINVESKDKA